MDILKAKKKEIIAVPVLENYERVDFNFAVIIPKAKKHSSGYRCMEFVLFDDDHNPIGRIGGCADAIYIQQNYMRRTRGETVHMDLLPCGLLRFWVNGKMFIDSRVISDMDVFYEGQN